MFHLGRIPYSAILFDGSWEASQILRQKKLLVEGLRYCSHLKLSCFFEFNFQEPPITLSICILFTSPTRIPLCKYSLKILEYRNSGMWNHPWFLGHTDCSGTCGHFWKNNVQKRQSPFYMMLQYILKVRMRSWRKKTRRFPAALLTFDWATPPLKAMPELPHRSPRLSLLQTAVLLALGAPPLLQLVISSMGVWPKWNGAETIMFLLATETTWYQK